MNFVQKFKEKIYYFYILYINVIIYLYMGPLLMGSSHSKWTQSWAQFMRKPLSYFTHSPHTNQKPQLIIHWDKRRLSPIDFSVPQFSLASSSSSSKHQKIKAKPLKIKRASKPCHQDQLLRPQSQRPCSRPQLPTSPRRLLNPRSPITHSMLHSLSGSFLLFGFWVLCMCVS